MRDIKIDLDIDGKPFIQADEDSFVFGHGYHQFEYTWKEIYDVCRYDWEKFIEEKRRT
jgi:hypothetical protein